MCALLSRKGRVGVVQTDGKQIFDSSQQQHWASSVVCLQGERAELYRSCLGSPVPSSASSERKSCCNWFLNEGSSAAPRRLGGL